MVTVSLPGLTGAPRARHLQISVPRAITFSPAQSVPNAGHRVTCSAAIYDAQTEDRERPHNCVEVSKGAHRGQPAAGLSLWFPHVVQEWRHHPASAAHVGGG